LTLCQEAFCQTFATMPVDLNDFGKYSRPSKA
jgi:hypothetical protein